MIFRVMTHSTILFVLRMTHAYALNPKPWMAIVQFILVQALFYPEMRCLSMSICDWRSPDFVQTA